jgi:hypothetical protein
MTAQSPKSVPRAPDPPFTLGRMVAWHEGGCIITMNRNTVL